VLVEDLSKLKTESETFYRDNFKTAGAAGNDNYPAVKSAVEEMVNGVIGIADEVGAGKISDPYNGNSGAGDSTIVESRYAYNSLDDFMNNIRSILYAYHGKRDLIASADYSLYKMYQASYPADADAVRDQILGVIQSIEAIGDINKDGNLDYSNGDMPFRRAVTDATGRARIAVTIQSLQSLKASLETMLSRLQRINSKLILTVFCN